MAVNLDKHYSSPLLLTGLWSRPCCLDTGSFGRTSGALWVRRAFILARRTTSTSSRARECESLSLCMCVSSVLFCVLTSPPVFQRLVERSLHHSGLPDPRRDSADASCRRFALPAGGLGCRHELLQERPRSGESAWEITSVSALDSLIYAVWKTRVEFLFRPAGHLHVRVQQGWVRPSGLVHELQHQSSTSGHVADIRQPNSKRFTHGTHVQRHTREHEHETNPVFVCFRTGERNISMRIIPRFLMTMKTSLSRWDETSDVTLCAFLTL